MRCFWSRGYGRTTTRDLVEVTGLGQSSITHAFGTKLDLLDAGLARYLSLLNEALLDPLRRAPDGLAAIDRFLDGLGEWHRADGGRGCMIGRLMCEGAGDDPRLAARFDEFRRLQRGALEAALQRAVAAEEIPAEGLSERRDLILAVVLGMNLAMQPGSDADAHRRLTDAGRAQIALWRRVGPHIPGIGRRPPGDAGSSIT